jgi:CHAT domain-containing protein/tetratricopeptide (TPR) repeat protein
MNRFASCLSRPFCSLGNPFDKAFLTLALLLGCVTGASLSSAASDSGLWNDFLAGRIDLDAALAAEQTAPHELIVEWNAQVEAGFDEALEAGQKLGVVTIKMGQPAEAIAILEQALLRAELSAPKLTAPKAAAFCRLHLGRALVHTRQVEEAQQTLLLALEAAEELGVPLWAGDAAIALSVLDRWAMDLDSSLAHRRAALASYEQIGYLKGEARARHYIGTIHVFRGELTRAMQVLQDALEVARQAEFPVEIAGTLTDLAGVNFLLGDFDRALAQYEEAATLTNHPWRRGQLSNNQGTMLADQGRHSEALPYLETALELMRQAGDERLEAEILLSLGRSQYELKNFDAGVANLDSAITLARQWQIPMTEAYALQYKGCAMLDQDRLDEAVHFLDEAETLAASTGFFDIREACHWAQALVARRRGDPQAALAQLTEGLAVVNDVRRLSTGSSAIQAGYFSQTRKTFDELIDLLYELHESNPDTGYDEQALAIVQQAKGRSFLDQLREAEVELRCQADPVFQRRERDLMEAIAALEGDQQQSASMARLENELNLLEAELRLADPRYAELKYPRSCTLAEAQREVLGPGELLLEFHLGRQASYLFSVSRESFEFHQLPAAEVIERQVDGLLPMLRDYNLLGDDASYYVAQAGPLSTTLLGDITGQLADVRHVIVAADGILNTVPFAALFSQPAEGADFSALPYLVKDVELSCAPSLSGLQRLRAAGNGKDTKSQRNLLILGRPRPETMRDVGVFARAAGVNELAEVPFAAEEIAGITASFDPAAVTLLESSAATVEGLMEHGRTGHRFVHFTTHGLFNRKRPLYSGLVLEPGPNSDGFLAVNEIFGLELDCDQVVLSACSSALGKQVGGEGLTGMTRAFLYAGAGSVMAALWDVAGSGTASFMADYYSHFASAGESTYPAGLARTQRRMISGELTRIDGGPASHPAFWAPFVITGGR